MKNIIYRTLIPVVIGLSILSLIILINQLNELAVLADDLVPKGSVIAWSVFAILFTLFLIPIIQLALLPKPLKRPKVNDRDQANILNPIKDLVFYRKYKKRVLRNFKTYNREFDIDIELKKNLINATELLDIQGALKEIEKIIDKESNKIIKQHANAIFVSTAISQNSGLDSILLLKIQIEMIWKIAHLYNQKPHWRELLSIYINVFANGLMAIGISEIPIDKVVEKITSNAFQQSMLGKIPGVDFAASLTSFLSDCLFEGTLNGLLTLRIGYITRDYCNYSVKFNKVQSVKHASKKAIIQMRTLSIEESNIFKTIIRNAKDKQTKRKKV